MRVLPFVMEDKLNRNLVVSILVCLFLTSCSSWVESTHKMIDRDERAQKEPQRKWVHIGQYNQVVSQNKELKEKVELLEAQLNKTSAPTGDLASEMVHDAGNDPGRDNLITEVVDLSSITNPQKKIPSKSVAVVPIAPVEPERVEKEVDLYQKAVLLKDNGNFDEAIKIFNQLGQAKSKQILVRVKNQLGHIYQAQGQFDLAIQMFKEVIEKYAFSGVVISALAGIVECYDKMGMPNEKLKYESLKELLGA